MPALLLLCAAQFMVILDITVVNVALPSIQGELGMAIGDAQWVVTAYTLAFGGLLLVGGRAADLAGRRRVFLAGLAVFTAASLVAALAGSTAALLVARAAQGVGAAMLSPAALSLVTSIFSEGRERQRALAAWAAVAASGGAFGVLAGGVITETLGWEAIFLINVPVGLAVGLGAVRLLPSGAPQGSGPVDVAGATVATGSLVALIYALVEGPSAGWASAQTLGLIALAGAGLFAFVAIESRAAKPLVRFAVLRRRSTATALVLMVAGMGTVLSAFFFTSLYLQEILGHSALRTGLEFLPGAVLMLIAAHGGGQLVSRLGAKPVLAGGMALGGLGALLLSGVSAEGSYLADVLPGLLVLDVGIGLAASGIFITALAGVADDEAGMVSGLTTTAHEIGIALVLPILSTVAAGQMGGGSLDVLAGLDPVAVVNGFSDAFRAAAALAFGAALLALAALRRSDLAPGAAPAFAHH
ncbi:MAG TPA: MFS transporter [Thermoleophilaceae bacterium]|jgi:EmrB/QacA subfamily drug resistance transporter|nr:MFS transporter [Thermoleophilaceae bacterium]